MTLKQVQAEVKQLVEDLKSVREVQAKLANNSNKNAVSVSAEPTVSAGPTAEVLAELNKNILNIETRVKQLEDRLSQQEQQLDDMEQYGRRNCLILHGCKNVPKGSYWELEPYILNILNTKIKLPLKVEKSDIDIAHTLPSKKGTPIIIKFVRRTIRQEVFNNKRNLAGSGMVITESLTKKRLALVQRCREKCGERSTWTINGNVYVFHENKKKMSPLY
uniref:Uncharacterized protein LOC108950143 n=1 Tax=Phallusia mammillata TaxID=59560 RepID=A0A6F9DJX5_9ASCI|nr:uncharacterized protein LOC108950143 [Phallusia mammillata]